MFQPPPLPRTLEASVRDLSSPKPQTRASAAQDLVRHALGSDATRGRALPLLEKALEDEAAMVRSAAAVALADLEAHEALPALIVAASDPDPRVAQMALCALGEIGDARAAQRLERALRDDRPEVRYQATIAYARVLRDRPRDVAAALARALGDEDLNVRYIALRVAEEHAVVSDALLQKARALAAEEDGSVALVAGLYLAKHGDAAGRALVLRLVRGELRAEREDEEHAVELAGELGMKEATADLEKRAWGLGRFLRQTHAWHAKIALARLGHPRARDEILSDLGSARRAVREAAVVAAGRARLNDAKATLAAMKADSVDPRLLAESLALLE